MERDIFDGKRFEIEKTTKEIYHYTDANALKSILNKNIFWVSKSDFLNDSTEIIYIQEIIDDVCSRIIDASNEDDLEFKKIISTIIQNTNNTLHDLYVLSFSENNDSQTLWSAYSSFTGYNIGIDINEIGEHINNIGTLGVEHGKVIYEKSKQESILEDEIKIFYKFFKETDLASESYDTNRFFFSIRMVVYSLFFKNPVFKNEEEYRFIFRREKSLLKNKLRYPNEIEVKFRIRNDILIPYIEIPLHADEGQYSGRIPIKSICIGPKNNIDIAKQGLEFFLENKKYDSIKIEKSKLPLRY